MKFKDLTINNKLVISVTEQGLNELTLIQEKCIPPISMGKDVVGQAETGSGKTLAFVLPILDKIRPKKGIHALVLTPTRELCMQVTDVFQKFGKSLQIKTTSIYGGVGIQPQIKNIQKSNIIVGTPGRILDHLSRKTINFSHLRFLVLDETDRMLDMGFIKDVEEIILHIPKNRQTLMFSATIDHTILRTLKKHLNHPIILKTQEHVDKTKLKQVYYDIYERNHKFPLLVHLLRNNTPGLAIVFCATRKESDILTRNLRHQRINALAIHGGMTQRERQKSLYALKNNQTSVLVATDVAARGLDIKNVTHIYNYDVPKTSKEYTHRIGRTARAGEIGEAVTLLTARDHDNFRRVQNDDQLEIKRADIPPFEKVPFIRIFRNKERRFKNRNYRSFAYQ